MRLRRLPYGFHFGPGILARLYDENGHAGFKIATGKDSVIIDIALSTGMIEVLGRRRSPPPKRARRDRHWMRR
jgi:hypothetical protein